MQVTVDPERLDLARRLSAAAPSWGIWKNTASALSGRGDIDSVVLREDEARIEEAFVGWAVENECTPVFRCDHAGDLMRVLVAVDRSQGSIVELDLTRRKTYRGSSLFTAAQMVPLLENDAAGFRRVRRGVEGVLLFFHNGVRYGGRKNAVGLDERGVVELLADDPEGVRRGADLFVPAARAKEALASALAGRWNRPALVRVEVGFLLRGLVRPTGLVRRVWFRAVTKRRCPIIHVAYTGRRLPTDVDGWLRTVLETHERLDRPAA
jgi:hypothetical protein